MAQLPIMPLNTSSLLSDTLDLTAKEFGAYCLILFYTWQNNGKAIPDDDERLARVCRMSVKEWRKVRPALERFFDLDGPPEEKKWGHSKLIEDFRKYVAQRQANIANGRLGGRPKSLKSKDRAKADGFDSVNPNETETKPNAKPKQNHMANHYNNNINPPISPLETTETQNGSLDGFQITERHREIAQENGLDIDRELELFRNWYASKGKRLKDYSRGFSNWLLKAGRLRTADPPQTIDRETDLQRRIRIWRENGFQGPSPLEDGDRGRDDG